MKIKKMCDLLSVDSDIYFDYNECFCGRTWIHLVANRTEATYWYEYSIGITIHDMDDYDLGLIYYANEDNFFDILHELINWMRDHEQGISRYEDMRNIFDFFPDLGCKRDYW
jgi:hypothetical protein